MEIMSIKGEDWRLKENSILNFHFVLGWAPLLCLHDHPEVQGFDELVWQYNTNPCITHII